MSGAGPLERARENVTGIVSVLVTGVWMAALFTDQGWWLGFMLFGYVVLVPVVALLFGDESDRAEWWDDDEAGRTRTERDREAASAGEVDDDALETLRARYARGELTDEQFERKVERLLETETLEDVEDRNRAPTAGERDDAVRESN